MKNCLNIIFLLFAAGCTKDSSSSSLLKGDLTAREAADTYFGFAYSAQVISRSTQQVIPHFSMDIVSKDGAINTVLNQLGDRNGLFHISRKPYSQDPAFRKISILVSASGYESAFQYIDIGADCETAGCQGLKPKPIVLNPEDSSKRASVFLPSDEGKYLENVLVVLRSNGGSVEDEKATWKQDLNLQMLLTYLQPLIQGLLGQQGNEIAQLFNQLVQEQGIANLKDMDKRKEVVIHYAQLLPYLQPLIRAMKSEDGPAFTEVLEKFLKGKDPAVAVASILSTQEAHQNVQLASVMFPGIQTLVQQWIPSKQNFKSQLFQGLKVKQDIKGSPAVVVSGRVRDLLKIAQLPNVSKVIEVSAR